MSLKSFFKSNAETALNKSNKISLNVSGSDIVKSYDDLQQKANFEQKIYAYVDISASLSNYVRFGLAEYHYETGIQRIYGDYPYDGSTGDKYKFLNDSTTFDYYIWKDLYPKTTGYITLNEGASSTQRVEVKAGPNVNNVYKASTKQANNLSFDASEGVTVEFWAKPNDSVFSGGIFETVDSSGNYFVIYLNNPGGAGVQFLVAKSSSAGGTEASTTFSTLTGYDNAWHHYALTFELNGSNNLVSTLYVDGEYTEQLTDSNTVSTTVNALSGNVGYAQTYYYTGSIDEFRYWKTKRTEKEIGLNWNTYVNGGSNATGTLEQPLALYLKFNEGITTRTATDSKVLDYSGRIASASILNYLTSSRSTSSAIVEYGGGYYEEPDPIIYSFHPDVSDLETEKVREGIVYDANNYSSFYGFMPEWIKDQDTEDLKYISHIIGAKFDEMYAIVNSFEKVKKKDYQESKLKIFPYYQALLEGEGFDVLGLFEGDALADLNDKTSAGALASGSLSDLKNKLYRNIYNNLLYIYKSKGTQAAVRNLLHCYGVDQNLMRIRTFSNNTTTTIDNRDEVDQFKDKTIDFFGLKNFVSGTTLPHDASIFNHTSSDANNQSYVTGGFSAYSLESAVYFPRQPDSDEETYFGYDTSGSVFGVHAADSASPSDTTFAGSDKTGLAVYAVHAGKTAQQGKFVLSSSNGVFDAIETSIYNIFDASSWNLAAVVEPDRDPRNLISRTVPYVARLVGYQVESGFTVNSFNITSSISAADGADMIEENKRVFVGAERTNFTGSLLYRSQARIGNCKFYGDSLEEDEVFLHAKYKNSEGRIRPFENVNRKNGNDTVFAPQYVSKIFEWDFEQVTTPDSGGQFEVLDATSASVNFSDAFGIYGTAVSKVYTGLGYNFPTDIKAFENEFVSKVRLVGPEESTAANVVNSQGESIITFQPNEAPAQDASILGKSMYDVVSQDMLKAFAGVTDFNYLIGSTVNRYRTNYKDLEALRRIYFDSVENNPELEKFVKYFKWLDSAIDTVIENLLPATTKLASESPNIVESHALERSKFALKYPTLENKDPRPTAVINSIVNTENIAVRLNLIDDNRSGAQGSFGFASSSAKTPNYVSVYQIGAEQPLSGAVTPVSIVNTQTVTSSDDSRREGSVAPKNFASSTVGNYNKGYEVVQAVGQKGAFNGRYLANESVPSVADTEFVSGTYNYEIVNRNKYKTVIRSIFNAPGSPETMHGALDLAAREFSVYNNLNYRNLIPRDFLRDLLVIPSAFGGYQSGSTVTASYHKTARNGYTRKEYSGANIVDKKIFDNYYVQTQIPATDLGYAWISSSYQSADINRYQTSSQITPNEQIVFLTASVQGADISVANSNETVYGFDAFATKKEADSVFLGDPFVPLNFWLLDPVSASSNRLGYPLSTAIGAYQLDGYAGVTTTDPEVGIQQLISTLNSRRNGPYGYASWRAYRKDSHPIVRAHRETNTISFLAQSKTTNTRGVEIFVPTITNVTQTPVNTTSPIFIRLEGTNFDFKVSNENLRLGFTNTDLQTQRSVFEDGLEKRKTFLDKVLAEPKLKIDTLTLRDTIYPLKNNQFLELTRARDIFDNTWWRDSRTDRQLTNTTNSFGFGVDGTTSRWSMDARDSFATSTPALSTVSADGSGELQNHYTTFHFFPDVSSSVNNKIAPLYSRRTIEYVYESGCNITSLNQSVTGGILNTGEALWEVGSQSGKNPFYNSYDNYAEELRLRGKDYSIVPEFRISEHIDTYLSNGFNFSAQLSDFLSLTGTSGFSVSRYSAAELSDVVSGIKEQTNLGVEKFGLKAKALLKLLPYEGFYPQQRTLQLAQELSSSYDSVLEGFTDLSASGDNLSYINPKKHFYDAFVSPGILFNTIKSGLAVDYPIYRNNSNGSYFSVFEYEEGLSNARQVGDFTTKNVLNLTGGLYSTLQTEIDSMDNDLPRSSSFPFLNQFIGISETFTNTFIDRVPFEAILDPKLNFEGKYEQLDPNNLGRNTGSFAIVNGQPKINYTLFANNFFAETVNFFLKRGLTSFESNAKDAFSFRTDKQYGMDLVLTNADVSSVLEFSEKIQKDIPQLTGTGEQIITNVLLSGSTVLTSSKNCITYDRADAFGFPAVSLIRTGTFLLSTPSRKNFTPPYYHGFARARYTFQPTQQQHTLDEIVAGLNIEYYRADENIMSVLFEDDDFSSKFSVSAIATPVDAMNIDSSFVVDAIVEEKKTKFNDDGDIVDFESFDTPRKKLVIHPKFESPVLNFKNVDITRPTNGSATAPKGMWHQNGEIPNYSDVGVFTEISDIPRAERALSSATSSLADVLGIKKEKKAIGRLATSTQLEEALVILPYYVDNTKDQPIRFFELNTKSAQTFLKKANRKSVADTDDQIVRQIRLMKKYVFPPFLDFVTFLSPDLSEAPVQTDVKKPLMYVFEFGRTLSQQDLANIWQGVAPDAAVTAVESEAVIDLSTNFAGLKETVAGEPTVTNIINANIQSLLASGYETIFTQEVKPLDLLNLEDLDFFVFRVKKRGEFDYGRITQNTQDDNLLFDFKAKGLETELPFFTEYGRKRLSYSYNYPYDFCSLIELAKVDAQIELSGSNTVANLNVSADPLVANKNQTVDSQTAAMLVNTALTLPGISQIASITLPTPTEEEG